MTPFTETHTVTDAHGSYTVTTVEGYEPANAPAPHGAYFNDAPTLTLPDTLKAQGWTLHQAQPSEETRYDLRTPADYRAEMDARVDALNRKLAEVSAELRAISERMEHGL